MNQLGDRSDSQLGLAGLADQLFDAVLFDLDGTLIDSTAAVTRSWLAWAVEHEIDPVRLRGYHGVPSRQIVSDLLPGRDVTAALAYIDERELLDMHGIVPLPAAVETLAALAGGRWAIVTSCSAKLAAARLAVSALTLPEVLVTADDVSVGKPDPEPYLLGAQRLGVDPQRCLVVEDATSGVTSARAAGASALAVLTTTAAEELPAHGIVGSLAEVAFLVTENGAIQVTAATRSSTSSPNLANL